jgi:REP element-mobilizing transposase RayT
MGRLPKFNYRSPFFYMVTLKKRKGLPVFSRITAKSLERILRGAPDATIRSLRTHPEAFLERTAVTKALRKAIGTFALSTWCIESITPVAIMPDHLHLLVHIRDTGDQMPLGSIVTLLMRKLAIAYWTALGATPDPKNLRPVFEREWHDWIVMRKDQCRSFNHYILTNPFRAWLRQRNRNYFQSPHTVRFLGRTWHAYGNDMLLERPLLVPLKGHRSTQPDSSEWKEFVARASRIGPGGAGISTFMSPLEKACGNAIAKAGGGMIVLSPDGFGDRWHPSEKRETFCAEGRMLFLSLYPPQERKLTNAELHERCHEMGEIVERSLGMPVAR